MNSPFQVIDQFCNRIDEARESAFAAGFGVWNPGKGSMAEANLDGMGFGGKHSILTHSLIKATGSVVVPNLTHFRITTNKTDRATIHSDSHAGPHTCIVYLTENENKGATAFWRHKETGLTALPKHLPKDARDGLMGSLIDSMAKSSMDEWEMVDLISGKYNRALIFDAPLFHSRFPLVDTGDSEETGRLVWICHYFKIEEMQ